MTLPELLVSVTLTGTLMATLALATNVMISNRANTVGRANNSRSEQNVGFFMPTDLASSEFEDTSPDAVPCGPTSGPDHLLGTADDVAAPPCPPGAAIGGSNALLLTWTSSVVVAGNAVQTTTKVSYRVILIGTEWQLIRVKCDSVGGAAPTCNTQIVLHDLTPPPPSVTFIPGVTRPDWIITVSKATAADDTSGPGITTPPVDPGLKNKNGQRVIVTINGGGGGDSASGGQSQIFLSAGGTNRDSTLSTEDLTGAPTFTAARSRCGGNIGMIVDTSNSIWNSQMASIKAGIRDFLDEFAGTPVKLQIVTFATTGVILGSSAGEPKWYDMLVDSDVQALKALIGDPAQSGNLSQQTGGSPTPVGIRQNGGTNWEDGFMRMLRNVDGTIPAQLPSKVIFFTDGVPTYSRLEHTSSTAPVTDSPLDAGLAASTGSAYSQEGWNRAERVVRDRGKVDVIGVMVGALPTNTTTHQPDTAYEDWATPSGYHFVQEVANNVAYSRNNNLVWEKAYHLTSIERNDNVVYERGSHVGYQVGNNVVWERGSHVNYQVGNNVVWERGYHLTTIQRNNNVVFERSSTGLTYERLVSGSWTTSNAATYFTAGNNSTPDSTDGWRVRITGTLGPTYVTTNMTQATYDTTNTTVDASDGFRARLNGSLSGSWTTVTLAQYNASNTTPAPDQSDGWRATKTYTSPFDTWEASTQAAYDPANTTVDSSDGWRTRQTAASTAWSNVTLAQYNASNSTSDATDGWQVTGPIYSAPYDTWTSTTQAAYDPANTTVDSSDGWRTRQTATSTAWTDVTLAQYNASNSTSDATDGWQTYTAYSAPYNTWTSTTSTVYDTAGNNSTTDATDGWRTRVNGSLSGSWTTVTQAQYYASNTTPAPDQTDGWRATNTYTTPFDTWESTTQAIYDTPGNNSTVDSSDGWRTRVNGSLSGSWTTVTAAQFLASNSTSDTSDGWKTTISGSSTSWTLVTQAQYDAANTSSDSSDGWRNTTKSYTPPYDAYDIVTKPISAIDLLGNVIVGDLSGNTGAYNRIDAPAGGAPYPDDAAAAADVFALPDYSHFADALDKIVLGECGGTVTLQTKNTADGLGAKDPFTYENMDNLTTVKTSAAFKSGTFDVAFPGENAKTITISPQEFTNLSAWTHVSWSCKSKGAAYPFTETPVPGHTAWTSIQLVVHANEAISCIQMVSYHG
ncbi:MAG TPA: hypothetical protein VHN36_07620 [Ilumatobacteraceae bacterium]|nr:hypothetical protein [Ilumatobacteraceae bacterium]